MKILFYKVPSYIHRVKYKKAVEDLYKTVISDDKFDILSIVETFFRNSSFISNTKSQLAPFTFSIAKKLMF